MLPDPPFPEHLDLNCPLGSTSASAQNKTWIREILRIEAWQGPFFGSLSNHSMVSVQPATFASSPHPPDG